MQFRLINFIILISISTFACATAIFRITPENTNIFVPKGQQAFVNYTIENNSGFATRIKILPPVVPQPLQINETNCPIDSGSLAYGASCTVQLMTTYAAQPGILGAVSVYDVSGNIGSKSIIPVKITLTSR